MPQGMTVDEAVAEIIELLRQGPSDDVLRAELRKISLSEEVN